MADIAAVKAGGEIDRIDGCIGGALGIGERGEDPLAQLVGGGGIEGWGVDPDIEVEDDPSKMVDGGDPQLDAAIELMLDELRKNPYQPPRKPKYPNRSGMGITKEDR